MKKIVLKKTDYGHNAEVQYKIPYQHDLNEAQYRAVMHNTGAALVIAGAGTGKTRTLVYRVARLVEDGIAPENILLLTFTRKSAQEMLRRASLLLDGRCERVAGGTFHSFANQLLRKYAQSIGFERNFTIMDQGDAEDTVNLLRAQMKLDGAKRRFPQKQTVYNMISAGINKCEKLRDVIEREYPQFSHEVELIEQLAREYHLYKLKNNVMDYDDLLLFTLKLLQENAQARYAISQQYQYIMVDEYQDTNKLQHEIVCALAGRAQNVVAVGDDAQSIYSFRGANFENIMRFPESFEPCTVITIEENYRSTQPILDLSNEVIKNAIFRYEKKLFTYKKGGDKPALICAKDERLQSQFVVQQILEAREQGVPLSEIAVLFRSGFLSFDIEIELTKANIPFRKFGGMKFIETAHIKDVLAMARLIVNPADAISWMRCLLLLDGVGPRTASQIVEKIQQGGLKVGLVPDLSFLSRGKETVLRLFTIIASLQASREGVGDKIARLCEYYRPMLKSKHDDFSKRWRDIEMLMSISERYSSMDELLSDMVLDPPTQSLADLEEESKEDEFLTLSTIHSAKGLEWNTVFLIWALDGRFPSAKSMDVLESLEEERRLFYVALTRAKTQLYLTYPTNIFDRESGYVLAHPTRFLEGIPKDLIDTYMLMVEQEETNNLLSGGDEPKLLE